MKINSEEYWDYRFESGNWDENEGGEQNKFFYNLLIEMMPSWIFTYLKANNMTIGDFGCATGYGTAILASKFGTKNVRGIDFSKSAIKQAKELFPEIIFEVGNINKYDNKVDVAILSNVIEHFYNPFEIVERISDYTNRFLIILIPLEENTGIDEHVSSFNYNDIPIKIGDHNLIYFNEVDCSKIEDTFFYAKQVLLIYTKDEKINAACSIQKMCGFMELYTGICKEYNDFFDKLNSIINKVEGQNNDAKLQEILNEQSNKIREILNEQSNKTKEILNEQSNRTRELLIDNNKATEELTLYYDKQVSELNLIINDLGMKYKNICEQLNNEIELKANIESHCNTLNTNYYELVNRFNSLNDAYGIEVSTKNAILNCRTWRYANNLKIIAKKTGLLKITKGLLLVKNHGLKEAIKRYKQSREYHDIKISDNIISAEISNSQKLSDIDKQALNEIEFRRQLYNDYLADYAKNKIVDDLSIELNKKKYKGIIVYPHAVHWHPMQRPQHILREFAKGGYLCFFCEDNSFEHDLLEVEDNLYIVRDEKKLLPFLQNKRPIILITYFLQTVFAECIPQKLTWLDILDRLDFFSNYGEVSINIYNELIKKAEIVTYSAQGLREYVEERKDAIYLPNAVNEEDFLKTDEEINNLDPAFLKVINSNKPIIGYYGAIEEWFNYNDVTYLADNLDCEIVIIGHVGIDPKKLDRSNIHLLGRKNYFELYSYSKHFSIGLIPFIINELTNSVSPVKFFEYCATGIPTVSSRINEMLQYECQGVNFYNNKKELVEVCKNIISETEKETLREKLYEIVRKNTWSNRFKLIEEKIKSDIRNLSIYSDLNTDSIIAVQAVTFFKYDGSNYYSGGAERYLIDLHELCSEMGIKLRVYQYGEYNWLRLYRNLEVVGMTSINANVNNYNSDLISKMNNIYNKIIGKTSILNIYSPFYIMDIEVNNSIGISHGISWDSEFTKHNENSFWNNNLNIINAAKFCNKMVSVDTNTANWFQTIDYSLGRKVSYIPNYVDNEEFKPRDDFNLIRDKIIITYPRRLYGARGLYTVLEILDDILEIYENVEFHFVGKGFEQDTKHVEKKVKRWNGRVKWYSCSPDKMYEVYKDSDICLIPTMYSEGTSLSCLEALSSGNAVIATRIGGLTDIIINDYNGILIEPTSSALKGAILKLLDNPKEMLRLKQVGRDTAKAFSKEKWKEKWKAEIKSALGNIDYSSYDNLKTCYISINKYDINYYKIVKTVEKLLNDNWAVFIATEKNKFKLFSYGRLQFVSLDEELYFEPTLRLSDSDDSIEKYYDKIKS